MMIYIYIYIDICIFLFKLYLLIMYKETNFPHISYASKAHIILYINDHNVHAYSLA